MSASDPKAPRAKTPGALVRNFVEDPMIRILGFLLIVAAGVLLYLNPESSVPLRWRGGAVPDTWQRVAVADGVTIALPPDLDPVPVQSATARYARESLRLDVYSGDDAFALRRDRDTMRDFRASTVPITGRAARYASWRHDGEASYRYHFGISLNDGGLTLVFAAPTEESLYDAKTAVQSLAFSG